MAVPREPRDSRAQGTPRWPCPGLDAPPLDHGSGSAHSFAQTEKQWRGSFLRCDLREHAIPGTPATSA